MYTKVENNNQQLFIFDYDWIEYIHNNKRQ